MARKKVKQEVEEVKQEEKPVEQELKEEAKLDDEMANIYDEKTREMSFDNTAFIKMNETHSALTSDNDTLKKIDTQISEIYKKKNKVLIGVVIVLLLLLISLLICGYLLYKDYNMLKSENTELNKEIGELNKEIEELKKEEEPIIYKQVFIGDKLIKNYTLSNYYNGYQVVNSSKEDLTSEELLNNLDSMLYLHNPSKVFINVGLNDLSNKVDNSTIVSNIKEIVRKIKEHDSNIKIYILSLVPLNNNDFTNIKSINEDLSKLSSIEFVDIYEMLKEVNGDTISSLYSENKKDLNSKGYEVLTDALSKYLEK